MADSKTKGLAEVQEVVQLGIKPIRRHGTFLYFCFVARLWRHITFDSSIFSKFLVEPGETAKHKGEHWTTANKAKKMTKKKKSSTYFYVCKSRARSRALTLRVIPGMR